MNAKEGGSIVTSLVDIYKEMIVKDSSTKVRVMLLTQFHEIQTIIGPKESQLKLAEIFQNLLKE